MSSKIILKFRREKFGGIIFNPENGCEIHLDKKSFDLNLSDKIDEKVYSLLEIKKNHKVKKEFFETKKFEHNFSYQILNTPTLADINITHKCNLHCPHCYINSHKNGDHMSLNDFETTLKACKEAGILQIALGGGEPTLHPNFAEILKKIHEYNIVPNLTSNGKKLNWKTVYAIKKYCGAMALSLEDINKNFENIRNFSYKEFQKSIKKIKAARIKLVFQITLSKNNINNIEKILNELLQYRPYGILFLAYKPQGRGKDLNYELSKIPTKILDQKIKSIFYILKNKTKIGFDCCSTPILVNSINDRSFVGCSAGRYSLAIMPNLDVMPCSFLNQKIQYDNLKNKNISKIWQGKIFNNFRKNIEKKINSQKCNDCLSKNICLGGCPIFNLANC